MALVVFVMLNKFCESSDCTRASRRTEHTTIDYPVNSSAKKMHHASHTSQDPYPLENVIIRGNGLSR